MAFNKSIRCFLITIICSYTLFGQNVIIDLMPDTLIAKKIRCSCNIDSYKIKIIEKKAEINTSPSYMASEICNYTYMGLYLASEEFKIKLIESLLTYENDSTKVCLDVKNYSSKKISPVISRKYSVQIDALYHINFICFGDQALTYSPCPVLIDTVTNEEINLNSKKITEVYRIYKQWFNESKKNDFKNFHFPLLNSRYRWKDGINKAVMVSELPYGPSKKLDPLGLPKSDL